LFTPFGLQVEHSSTKGAVFLKTFLKIFKKGIVIAIAVVHIKNID
jgi:hypothetical protein